MNTSLTTRNDISLLEQVVVGGNLANMQPAERLQYYRKVCESIGLNPLTRPFEYITLNGKLTLYARKDAADQLRKVHGVSIDKPDIRFEDDWIIVAVSARLPDGRADSDVGVVSRKDMRGDFGNALMKAVTKAKRRVTLSIVGLGWLDETEVETIRDAQPVKIDMETGEIMQDGNGNGHQSPADDPAELGRLYDELKALRARELDFGGQPPKLMRSGVDSVAKVKAEIERTAQRVVALQPPAELQPEAVHA